MICDLRLTIDNLKVQRASIHRKMTALDQAIDLLEQINNSDGLGEKNNSPAKPKPSVPLPAEIPMRPPGPGQPLGPALPSGTLTDRGIKPPRGGSSQSNISPVVVPPQDAPAPGRRRQRRKINSKKKGSFRGIRLMVSRRDGSVKYRTTYWDSGAKKNMTLGLFDDELKAALAVARQLNDASEVKRIKELITQRDNHPAQSPKKTKPPAGLKKTRQPKLTHYKGVKLSKPRLDGTPRYEVNVYLDRRLKYLGTFTTEEEAAAVAAEARGEHTEAKRLRELVKQKTTDEQEQRENKPDRPASRRQTQTEADPSNEDQADKTLQVWECKNCFKQYIQVEQPSKCLECSHEKFRAIV